MGEGEGVMVGSVGVASTGSEVGDGVGLMVVGAFTSVVVVVVVVVVTVGSVSTIK